MSENIPDIVINYVENWKVELAAEGQTLAEVKIKRGIFRGDSLSPQVFVTAMMPLSYVFRKYTGNYKSIKLQEKINPLMQDVCRKWKRTGGPNTNNKNVRPGYRNGMVLKMSHADNEKWEKRNHGKNRIAKSGKHQNTCRERKLKILGNYNYQGKL